LIFYVCHRVSGRVHRDRVSGGKGWSDERRRGRAQLSAARRLNDNRRARNSSTPPRGAAGQRLLPQDRCGGRGCRQERWARADALSARAERLFAHRSREAVWIDFGVAEQFGGMCFLRFGDTNLEESAAFVDAIKREEGLT
jgi:hypothetical protein